MKSMIRAIVLAALTLFFPPVEAAENGAGADGSLEQRIVDLERRVSELEAISKSAPSKPPQASQSGNWKDRQNWRQLRTGMSYDEVRALLGEPESIDGGTFARWYWGRRDANVAFTSGKVSSWEEPR